MFPKMTMIGDNASAPATTIKKTNKRTSSTKWFLAYGIAFCALAAWMITVCDAKPAPVPPQELADALKVLQQLDRYYSQVARPRFGKRADVRSAALGTFGDATNADQLFNEQMYHNPAEEWGAQYSRRR